MAELIVMEPGDSEGFETGAEWANIVPCRALSGFDDLCERATTMTVPASGAL